MWLIWQTLAFTNIQYCYLYVFFLMCHLHEVLNNVIPSMCFTCGMFHTYYTHYINTQQPSCMNRPNTSPGFSKSCGSAESVGSHQPCSCFFVLHALLDLKSKWSVLSYSSFTQVHSFTSGFVDSVLNTCNANISGCDQTKPNIPSN